MDDREQLVKKLKKAEQEVGVLNHKLKQRKEDKNIFNTRLKKYEALLDDLRTDLKLAYENLEKGYQREVAMRKAFKALTGHEIDREINALASDVASITSKPIPEAPTEKTPVN